MKLIDKAALVAEIERRRESNAKEKFFGRLVEDNYFLDFLNTLEAKEVCMSALDNGNMPVERWKEACKAASCQANYRKSKGLTENRDDYFVDGVQWADEHPIKMKEVDLEKELESFAYTLPHSAIGDGEHLGKFDDPKVKEARKHGWSHLWRYNYVKEIANHFFELGLKVKQESNDDVKIGEAQIYLEDDGGEPPYDGKQWLDLSCTEYEIPKALFKDGDNVEILIRKAQKGE